MSGSKLGCALRALSAGQFSRLFYGAMKTGSDLIGGLRELLHQGLLDDALVIVTGDHGEELGESGYYGHKSLYDANVPPFMAIKPPTDAEWSVPDAVDTVDFLPTVARALGKSVPGQCRGRPLQAEAEPGARVMERVTQQWYNVAVEVDDLKSIHTFESSYPDRASGTTAADAVHVEYHRLTDVRNGDYTGVEPADPERTRHSEILAEFLDSPRDPGRHGTSGLTTVADSESTERLEYLGYK